MVHIKNKQKNPTMFCFRWKMKCDRKQPSEQQEVLSLEDGWWRSRQKRAAFQAAAMLSSSEVSEKRMGGLAHDMQFQALCSEPGAETQTPLLGRFSTRKAETCEQAFHKSRMSLLTRLHHCDGLGAKGNPRRCESAPWCCPGADSESGSIFKISKSWWASF